MAERLTPIYCKVPARYLSCEPRPAKPADEGMTDNAAGFFIVDNDTAGNDCRVKLQTVAAILADCEAK